MPYPSEEPIAAPGMKTLTPRATSLLQAMDDAPVNGFHWRTVIATGMGFFTDAYDLFIIGSVTTLLSGIWHLNTLDLSILSASSFLSAAAGAAFFGWVMDRKGRQWAYGLEALLLMLGALASALAPNFTYLLIARLIVGFGVGGDYPASAVIISEFANRANRGRLVTTVFSFQGLGYVVGPAITAIALASHLPADITWRLLLALGAVPAALVMVMRRSMPETPRFHLHVQGNAKAAMQAARSITQNTALERGPIPLGRERFTQSPFLRRLFASCACWFLVDIAFYGNGVSSQSILRHVFSHASLLQATLLTLIMFSVTGLPGYFVAARFMDGLGRKKIQFWGFLIVGGCYGLMSRLSGMTQEGVAFIALYGISYFFIEFGPNTTTFLYPSELFPTRLRGRGHGTAAAIGKLGAFLGAFLLPLIIERYGLTPMYALLAIVSVIGAVITHLFLPEPSQRALEEVNAIVDSNQLHTTYSRILSSMNQVHVEGAVTEEILHLSGADLVIYYELDEHKHTFTSSYIAARHDNLTDMAQDLLSAVAAHVDVYPLLQGACRTLEATVADKGQLRRIYGKEFPLQSLACFPLHSEGDAFGLLTLWDLEQHASSKARMRSLRSYVSVASAAIFQTRQFMSVQKLALTDALTQLNNRAGFEAQLERRIEQTHAQFAFIMIDLDHFKQRNDRLGHQAGDEALCTIAATLRSRIRPQDVCARLGGDEFILLFQGIAEVNVAANRVKELVDALALNTWGLGLCVGISFFPKEGTTYKDLYRMADARLYQAKALGRGRMVAVDEATPMTL